MITTSAHMAFAFVAHVGAVNNSPSPSSLEKEENFVCCLENLEQAL